MKDGHACVSIEKIFPLLASLKSLSSKRSSEVLSIGKGQEVRTQSAMNQGMSGDLAIAPKGSRDVVPRDLRQLMNPSCRTFLLKLLL